MGMLYLIHHTCREDAKDSHTNVFGRLQAYVIGRSLCNARLNKVCYTSEKEREYATAIAEICAVEPEYFPTPPEEALERFTELAAANGRKVAVCSDKKRILPVLRNLIDLPSAREGQIVQPPGCINTIQVDHGKPAVLSFGEDARICLNKNDCIHMLQIAHASDEAIKAGIKTAEKVEKLEKALEGSSIFLDRSLLQAAALLHRISEDSAEAWRWLDRLGFHTVAEAVGCQNLLSDDKLSMISEAMLLFLALRLDNGNVERYLAGARGKDRSQTDFVYDLVFSAIQQGGQSLQTVVNW